MKYTFTADIDGSPKTYSIPYDIMRQYEVEFVKPNEYAVFSQRDPRWKNVKLGNSKTSTIGQYGCFVTCLSMMVNKRPDEVNEILKKAGAFNGDLLISEKAAEALNLEYKGREYNINNMPQYSPSIKEVRMGKSQHFVLRIIDKNDSLSSKISGALIVDPWTGLKQRIDYYPFKSYRLFKRHV